MNISKNNVIVCPPTKQNIHRLLKIIGNDDFKWAYFGEDISGAIAVKNWIGTKGERIDIAGKLQKIADSLRQPYINYIGELSIKYNSILWWAGSLSEKNPFISSIFLHSCYIKVALSLFEAHKQGNLVFFVESRALRSSLVENISSVSGHEVINLKPKFSYVLESLTDRIEFIIKHGWFILNNIFRIILTRHIYHFGKPDVVYKKGNSNSDLTLIHTWVDQRSFTEDNEFQDAYFGTLGAYMAKKGKNVVIVPSILHTVSYTKTIKKLMHCKGSFLVPYAHLKILDILIVVKNALRKPVKKSCPHFEYMNISDLIHFNRINDWKNTRLTTSLLLYYIVKNWKKQNLSIERFIYTHENHTWEKIYCIAFREYFPGVTLVGYQHSTVNKMYLFYSISLNEREVMPFPDYVITNGKHFKQLLLDSGYDPDKVISGGAVRYKYITELTKQITLPKKFVKTPEKKFKILVAASINKNESIELLQFVLNTFESLGMYNIVLKFHPLMPYKEIENGKHFKISLPKNFIISSQPINILLNECDVLLYKTTTICVEALATGVYPIHIKSNYVIDYDILDGTPDGVHSSVSTDEELLNILKELDETTPEESYKRRMAAKRISEDFFGSVNDSVLELFMQTVKK